MKVVSFYSKIHLMFVHKRGIAYYGIGNDLLDPFEWVIRWKM